MGLGKRLIQTGSAACLTETTDIFGDSSGKALYSMDYDASDTSGAYSGTPTDVDFGVSGKTVNGARFNGSSSVIALPSSAPFGDDDTIKSISAWVKLTTTSSIGVVYTVSSSTNASDYFTMQVRGDLNTVFITSRNGSTSNSFNDQIAITPDTNWHHYVFQLGSTEREIYIDGVKKTLTKSNAGTATDTSWISYPVYDNTIHSDIGLGRRSSAYYSAMTLDQVRMFSRVLTGTEISTLYNSGNGETACVHTSTTDNNDFPVTNTAYYKLDNSAEDSHSGTYDGTQVGDFEYRFGKYGQAAVFNGSNSYITVPALSGFTNYNFTMSFWFNSTSTAAQYFIDFRNPIYMEFGYDIGSGAYNNTYSFVIYTGTQYAIHSSADLRDGNWHHIAVTYDGATLKMYIDNDTPITSTINDNTQYAGTGNVIGGAVGGSAIMDGKIDQLRIFSSELSSSQITQLYNEKPETDTSNFKAVLYEGTGAGNHYVSNVGFQPDLVWLKNRDASANHKLYDSVRNEVLESNTTAASGSTTQITSLDANGFTLGGSASVYNGSNTDYVAWVFKGGGDAVTDNSGDVSAEISANTDLGFSIVKYNDSGTSGQTVAHGLDSAPTVMITKTTDTATDWVVYTTLIDGGMDYLKLNDNVAAAASSLTVPTSSFIYSRGQSSTSIINYLFHSVNGISKMGTYEGNGTTDNKIYTTNDGTSTGSNGFKPSFVMLKNLDTSNTRWIIMDTARDPVNTAYRVLSANLSNAESDSTAYWLMDFESDGFRLKYGADNEFNKSGDTFIYMAFK